jgi:Guanylate-binding protein, N-terminal domain
MYNSVGSIDENVLNNLSLVVNLSKSLQIKNDSKAEDPDELAEYFPSFLWILRDFALKLVD